MDTRWMTDDDRYRNLKREIVRLREALDEAAAMKPAAQTIIDLLGDRLEDLERRVRELEART